MGKIEIEEERLLQIIEYGEKMAALARQALADSKNKFHIYTDAEKAIQGPSLQPGEIPEEQLRNVHAGVQHTPEELAAMMEESHQQLQPGEMTPKELEDVHAGYPKPYALTNDGNNPYR